VQRPFLDFLRVFVAPNPWIMPINVARQVKMSFIREYDVVDKRGLLAQMKKGFCIFKPLLRIICRYFLNQLDFVRI
jgi:hypothetical protein